MEIIFSYIPGIILLWIMGHVVYMQVHMQEEKRQNKGLPLYWEEGGWFYEWKKKRKQRKQETFDKSKVKYFDGDNT